jgi:hypothetical protein
MDEIPSEEKLHRRAYSTESARYYKTDSLGMSTNTKTLKRSDLLEQVRLFRVSRY